MTEVREYVTPRYFACPFDDASTEEIECKGREEACDTALRMCNETGEAWQARKADCFIVGYGEGSSLVEHYDPVCCWVDA